MSTYHAGVTLPPRHTAGDDDTTRRVPRAPGVILAHPRHLRKLMSMNTEGLPSTNTTSIDIQDAFQRHYSSRAVQDSKHIMTNVLVEEGEDANIIAVLEKSAPKQTLSEIRRTHSDQMFASIPESNTSVGSTNTLAKSEPHTDFSNATSDMSDQQILYKAKTTARQR